MLFFFFIKKSIFFCFFWKFRIYLDVNFSLLQAIAMKKQLSLLALLALGA